MPNTHISVFVLCKLCEMGFKVSGFGMVILCEILFSPFCVAFTQR